MKKVPKAHYPTAAEIDLQIEQRRAEASKLPLGSPQRQLVLKEIAQLRTYADAKRLFGSTTT